MADGAILAVLPDPIICCKNAKFQQEQVKSRGVAQWSPASAFVNDAAYQLALIHHNSLWIYALGFVAVTLVTVTESSHCCL